MLIAQALAEYGVATALLDGMAAGRILLAERVSEVEPLTWGVIVVGAAAVWLMFLRR